MSDMMNVLFSRFKESPVLEEVCIKPFYRPEALLKHEASVVIVPMAPPKQSGSGSNQVLRKEFVYQINVEASTLAECGKIALEIEQALASLGFYQLNGGLAEYFVETERYVDARRYRGYSDLYQVNY